MGKPYNHLLRKTKMETVRIQVKADSKSSTTAKDLKVPENTTVISEEQYLSMSKINLAESLRQ